MFPDVKNATEKSFVHCISGMEFAYNLYDVTLELLEICDAFPVRTLAEEEELLLSLLLLLFLLLSVLQLL